MLDTAIDFKLSGVQTLDYLAAMEQSPVIPDPIRRLITSALTDKISDREIFMKGIDYSYYYETIDGEAKEIPRISFALHG